MNKTINLIILTKKEVHTIKRMTDTTAPTLLIKAEIKKLIETYEKELQECTDPEQHKKLT
jgi:hypothetical protein